MRGMAPARFVPLVEPPREVYARVVFTIGDGTVAVDEVTNGVESPAQGLFIGMLDGRPCWAVEASQDSPSAGQDLRSLWGEVDDVTWAAAGRAVQLVEWDRTHRFCGRCATPTEPSVSERSRRCPKCGLLAFPRLAPAIITLIRHPDGRALLARGRAFPVPMYSCLAGFVEPGETLEQAVHREVGEEVGVEIDDVRYFASQPWPFPHSLMIGFTARWAAGDIAIDHDEIVDADWFAPDALPVVPPPISIARRLIDDWLADADRGHG
jgi:NAD+ diphosphatase